MPSRLDTLWNQIKALLEPALVARGYRRLPGPPRWLKCRRESDDGIVSGLTFGRWGSGDGCVVSATASATHRDVVDLYRRLHPGLAPPARGKPPTVPWMALFDARFDDEARFRHGEALDRRFGEFFASLRATAFRFVDRHRTLEDILETMAESDRDVNDLVIVAMLVLGELDEARWMVGKERNRTDLRGGSDHAVDQRAFLRNAMACIRRTAKAENPASSDDPRAARAAIASTPPRPTRRG